MTLSELLGTDTLTVKVTRKDISEGVPRSCEWCAVSLALSRALSKVVPEPRDWECSVEPYACFIEAEGVTFTCNGNAGYRTFILAVEDGPDGLIEWTIDFDDWKESRRQGVRNWMEETGREDRPYNPGPVTFVFDLTKASEVVHA